MHVLTWTGLNISGMTCRFLLDLGYDLHPNWTFVKYLLKLCFDLVTSSAVEFHYTQKLQMVPKVFNLSNIPT